MLEADRCEEQENPASPACIMKSSQGRQIPQGELPLRAHEFPCRHLLVILFLSIPRVFSSKTCQPMPPAACLPWQFGKDFVRPQSWRVPSRDRVHPDNAPEA